MMIDVAGERSEQGRSPKNGPDSSNAVLDGGAMNQLGSSTLQEG
jgi:hypothetical protein